MCTFKYTPESLSKEKISDNVFSIPLYQRLFEWEEPQIKQLLNDIYDAYKKDPEKPYYIGMLTVHVENESGNGAVKLRNLVDGQQRFTVMMLLGIVFKWESFVKDGDKLRLSFYARPKDKEFLLAKAKGEKCASYVNRKMEVGIRIAEQFIENLKDEQDSFKSYAFNNLTFFITQLPENYKSNDLNKYFESMNAAGKGLENHEILKVTLLKGLPPDTDKVRYTRIWNLVSEMDKPLMYQNTDESVDVFNKRMTDTLEKIVMSCSDIAGVLEKCNNKNDEKVGIKSIKDISISSTAPETKRRAVGVRSILSFPEFLLLVLGIQTEKSISMNVHKLQETFKEHLSPENYQLFFENLLLYRILFDYYIIKESISEGETMSYTLAMTDEQRDSAEDKTSKKALVQYQSMLYVSTSAYIWLIPILKSLRGKIVTTQTLLNDLKSWDNNFRALPELTKLKYGEIDRYWFWRLDYYLWENWKPTGNKEIDNSVSQFVFRANRSIEHLHPQNPSTGEKWDEKDLHSFGNLALISSSFNSTQSNDDENVKFARVENQIAGKFLLESIKLVKMYLLAKSDNQLWTTIKASEHGDDMYQVLEESFSIK